MGRQSWGKSGEQPAAPGTGFSQSGTVFPVEFFRLILLLRPSNRLSKPWVCSADAHAKVMKRSFTSLTPPEALHVAIFIEERNAELYHRFAEMFREFGDSQSLEVAGVFWEMAAEERRHSTELQQRYMERHGNASCALTEEDLQEIVEVPRLETSELFDDPDDTAKPAMRERALRVALAAEIGARKFYAGLADVTSDLALHKLYRELAEFEDEHVDYLEKKIARGSTKQNER